MGAEQCCSNPRSASAALDPSDAGPAKDPDCGSFVSPASLAEPGTGCLRDLVDTGRTRVNRWQLKSRTNVRQRVDCELRTIDQSIVCMLDVEDAGLIGHEGLDDLLRAPMLE